MVQAGRALLLAVLHALPSLFVSLSVGKDTLQPTAALLARASLSALDVAKEKLECRDSQESCPAWAEDGECDKNPSFMLSHCALSCQNCEHEELRASASEHLLYALRAAALVLPSAADLHDFTELGAQTLEVLERFRQNLSDIPADVLHLSESDAARNFFTDIETEVYEMFDFKPSDLKLETTAKLRDGRRMPVLGFGTWQLTGTSCEEAVLHALSVGYRHIDGAEGYGNDADIGRALRRSRLPREELFITNKLSDTWGKPARNVVLQQLEQMGTDYFDLYMLHGPHHDRELMHETWTILEALVDEGKIRSLGVSNFDDSELDKLLGFSSKPIVYLQNKLSPFRPGHQHIMDGQDLLNYTRKQGIMFVGYSAVNKWPGQVDPLDDVMLQHLADLREVSVAQLLNRWVLQLGAAAIPRSSNNHRIEENSKLFTFSLTPHEMSYISGLHWLVYDTYNVPFFPNVFGVEKVIPGPVYVSFQNDLENAVQVAWVNSDVEHDIEEVAAGDDIYLNSFIGHIFSIRPSDPAASPSRFHSGPLGFGSSHRRQEDGRLHVLMSAFQSVSKDEL